jgi:hypothetical protein
LDPKILLLVVYGGRTTTNERDSHDDVTYFKKDVEKVIILNSVSIGDYMKK